MLGPTLRLLPFPQVTYIQQLISGSKLLPEDADIPTATYILPDNGEMEGTAFGAAFAAEALAGQCGRSQLRGVDRLRHRERVGPWLDMRRGTWLLGPLHPPHPPYSSALSMPDAITKLLSSFGVTFDQAIAALGAGLLPAAIQNRLNSVILYHIIPSGALTPTELGAEGTVPTALPEESLQFSADGAVITTATGTSNVLANGDSAGASYLIVDAALLPADFNTVAETTTEEAKAILAALGSSTPSPTLE